MTSSIKSPTRQTAIAPMMVDVRSARSDSADAFRSIELLDYLRSDLTHIAPVVQRKLWTRLVQLALLQRGLHVPRGQS
eukprot:3169354-Pleurochrysis_carterae.AAC.6